MRRLWLVDFKFNILDGSFKTINDLVFIFFPAIHTNVPILCGCLLSTNQANAFCGRIQNGEVAGLIRLQCVNHILSRNHNGFVRAGCLQGWYGSLLRLDLFYDKATFSVNITAQYFHLFSFYPKIQCSIAGFLLPVSNPAQSS